MRKYLIGLGIIGTSFCVCVSQAQKPQAKKKVVYKGKTYLSDGKATSGKISKKVFDSLITYPLVAKDTNSVTRPVVRFVFSYAERGAFEDSTGKLRIMTDYYTTESEGNILPADWVANIKSRSKEGDTAIFSEVLGTYSDSLHTRFNAEPLKLIITE